MDKIVFPVLQQSERGRSTSPRSISPRFAPPAFVPNGQQYAARISALERENEQLREQVTRENEALLSLFRAVSAQSELLKDLAGCP